MADKTKIEWADSTWNVLNGCTLVSDGCTNCYAAKMAATRLKNHPSRKGLARFNRDGVAKFTGEVRFNEKVLNDPLKWRKPRKIFVCAHGDLFHESVPFELIDRVFVVMALAPQHTFQILTKRPERMRQYLSDEKLHQRIMNEVADIAFSENINVTLLADTDHEAIAPSGSKVRLYQWPLSNVCLGTSIEDQFTADVRIPYLLKTPAAIRWVSYEPALGAVNFNKVPFQDGDCRHYLDILTGHAYLFSEGINKNPDAIIKLVEPICPSIDWVVMGGESGPNARPMSADWARNTRDQCEKAGVPFLFKQWGEWFPFGEIDANGSHNTVSKGKKPYLWHEHDEGGISVRLGKKWAGRYLDGVIHDAFPQFTNQKVGS